MRFVIGTKSAGGVRGAGIALAIAASLWTTGALAQSCDQYAANAVAQTQEYQNLGCSGGSPDWWSVDPAWHRNWCVSLPAGSSEPANGAASREGVLQQCRQSQRPQQSQRPPPQSRRPAVGSPPQGQRPPVFEGTVCDHWQVQLQHEDTIYSSIWQRGNGFFYRARWYGGETVIDRFVYPLNANLSFWSEDAGLDIILYYYNERSLELGAGEIGGPWEAEAPDGEILDDGEWYAMCLDSTGN